MNSLGLYISWLVEVAFFGAMPDKTEAQLHLSKCQTAFRESGPVQFEHGNIKLIILCCLLASITSEDQSPHPPDSVTTSKPVVSDLGRLC